MTTFSESLRVVQQEHMRLLDEHRVLRDELYRLREAIRVLVDMQNEIDRVTSETDIFMLLRHILSAAMDAVDSENGSIILPDEEHKELVFIEVLGPERDSLLGYRMPINEGVAGWVISNHKPLLVPDVSREPRFSPLVDETIGFRTNSLIGVPLVNQGRIFGVIEVVNTRSGDPLNEKDFDIMLLVARLASLALARAERGGLTHD